MRPSVRVCLFALWMSCSGLVVAAEEARLAAPADAVAAEQAPPEEAPGAEAGEEPAAAPAAAPAAPADDGPLVANGLLEQVIAAFGVWMHSLASQLREAGSAIGDVALVGQWLRDAFATPPSREAAWRGLGALAAVLLAGFLAERLLVRLLRRPRELVAARAVARHEEIRARQARSDERAQAAATAPPAAATSVASAADAGVARPTELPPPLEPETGVTRVEAGMLAPAAFAAVVVQDAGAVAARVLQDRRKAVEHWGLFTRMPYALGHAVLCVLPVAAFLIAAGLLMNALAAASPRLYLVALPILNAYLGMRLALGALRLLASPTNAGLRLLTMSDAGALGLWRWARAIFLVAAAGMALGEVAVHLGAGWNVRTLIAKLTSLVVHLMLVVLVLRTRHAVSARIRGRHDDGLRAFLADAWPAIAIGVIVTFWVVWALGVPNGFQRVLRFLAVSAAVLVLARLVWIGAVGLLDRAFQQDADTEPATSGAAAAGRYHALLRHLVTAVVGAAALVGLLQAWGVDALAWFEQGTVGRRLASAATTIGVAAALAIVVWEAVSLALNRRIQLWADAGDTVRAARLRTLVPMLRTIVLVAIGLTVLMTALNELGINVGPLLAGASILGVALGFGSQKLVQDFINGIFLLMENAMQVGDTVTVAGVSGTVEYLSIRTVRLRAADGSLHVVPFSSVTTVNNINRGQGNAAVRVSVAPESDVQAVCAELRAIAAEMRGQPAFAPLMLGELEIWGVDVLDVAAITITGQIRTTDRGRWPVQREFNRRVLERFREREIRLAKPS